MMKKYFLPFFATCALILGGFLPVNVHAAKKFDTVRFQEQVKSPVVAQNGTRPPRRRCVHKQDFWRRHNKFRRHPKMRKPWPAPVHEWRKLCGMKLIDILKEAPCKRPWFLLAQEWIAAQLNIVHGARPVPPGVRRALRLAKVLLQSTCGEKDEKNPQGKKRKFFELLEKLEAFNCGTHPRGPRPCRKPCKCCCVSCDNGCCRDHHHGGHEGEGEDGHHGG